MEDCVARLSAFIAPPVAESPLVPASPFDLVAGFDYLDVVWRLKFKAPLVALPGAERVARRATDATSPGEFESRLSAGGISRSNS